MFIDLIRSTTPCPHIAPDGDSSERSITVTHLFSPLTLREVTFALRAWMSRASCGLRGA